MEGAGVCVCDSTIPLCLVLPHPWRVCRLTKSNMCCRIGRCRRLFHAVRHDWLLGWLLLLHDVVCCAPLKVVPLGMRAPPVPTPTLPVLSPNHEYRQWSCELHTGLRVCVVVRCMHVPTHRCGRSQGEGGGAGLDPSCSNKGLSHAERVRLAKQGVTRC